MRVYAEDPENNFLPDTGKLQVYRRPQGAGVRVDDGYEEGMDIPIYYDPMIAKLITYGKDRTEAIERMKRAIVEYQIVGIKTTLPFCQFVLDHEEFVSGKFTTKFVEQYFKPELLKDEVPEDIQQVAAIFAYDQYKENKQKAMQTSSTSGSKTSGWKSRMKAD